MQVIPSCSALVETAGIVYSSPLGYLTQTLDRSDVPKVAFDWPASEDAKHLRVSG